jgi:SagB-type dehydrogenase family enzyme
MRIDNRLGTLAEEYHVASRNQGAFKHIYKAHQVHYQPQIQQLMADAPLHQVGRVRVSLPSERVPLVMPVDEAIRTRVSGRQFDSAPLGARQLSTLLYLANAVRRVVQAGPHPWYQRNVASSGNLGSVEIYPIVLNVTDVEPGIYHFDTVRHDLAQLRTGQFRNWLHERVFFQCEFSYASVALALTGAIGRLTAKYSVRGYRLALLDAGHVSENLYLAGTALGLQVCATAGFIDDEVDAALGLDGLDAASLLVVLVGTTAGGDRNGT